MNDDPFWAQKKTQKENRNRILSVLFKGAMTFTQLENEVGLSKPILSKHLKFLQEQKQIDKDFINDRVVYRPAKEAFKLPLFHKLAFEGSALSRITGELSRERKDYIRTATVLYQDKRTSEKLIGSEIDPQIVREKSEGEIIQAIDKWLTPIVLYAIIQELKTEHDWTEAIHGISQKLLELIKLKDVGKFEEALREKYSTLVQKYYFILPQEKIPLIDSLDGILEYIKGFEIIDWYDEYGWPSRKKVPPHVDRLTKRFVKRRKGKGKVFIHE